MRRSQSRGADLAQKQKACKKCEKWNKNQKAKFISDYVTQTKYNYNLDHKRSVK